MARHRRSRFGGAPRSAVTQSRVTLPKRRKCKGCAAMMEAGETVIRLRLKKHLATACDTCGHKLTKVKVFHDRCVPQDINKAMGHDPTKFAGHAHAPAASTVPPPPKPPTAEEAALAGIVALEAALIARLRNNPKAMTPELKGNFKTLQGIKARVMRGSTTGEQDNATSLALQRLIKMIFANPNVTN